MLDQALEALKTFDWGTDMQVLEPIERALITTRDDSQARADLETRLAAVLDTDASRSAKDFVCRRLRTIGTARAVPALAALLPQKDHSHMARYALEWIPDPQAAAALRDALGQVEGELKIGVISSLGARRDADSVSLLGSLLSDADAVVACAAAHALGAIRTAQAAEALEKATPAEDQVKRAATDASLACAEALLAGGKKAEALAVYRRFASEDQPRHVRLAATRGMLEVAGRREP
jgi:HEAT repeat protein